jgi:hypothetical protein
MARRLSILGAVVVLCSGLLLVPTGANAATTSAPAAKSTTGGAVQIDEAGMRSRFTAAGVSKATQDRLIAKFRAGITWDSQNGSKPVSDTTKVVGDEEVTTQTFADGSLIINSIEIPKPASASGTGIQPQSISGCRAGSGVGSFPFYDCHIATNQFSFDIDFYSDGMTSNIGAARVSNYRNIGYWTAAATVNSTGFQLIRSVQSGSSEAAVRATLYVTFLVGSGSGVYQLTFHVRDTTKWDTSP